MRPNSLKEVAELAGQGEPFDLCFRNFLDEFYAAPAETLLAEQPPLLGPAFDEIGRVWDAYLAAAAEELARSYQFRMPSWIAGDARRLHIPWFASPLAALRAALLLESPPAFRSRNLFVSGNALNRA